MVVEIIIIPYSIEMDQFFHFIVLLIQNYTFPESGNHLLRLIGNIGKEYRNLYTGIVVLASEFCVINLSEAK